MKIHSTAAEVHVSNTGETNNFSINVTNKAFKILSDGLYTNKIQAIVREISCNAYDAQVSIGKEDTPFEVTCPTVLSPIAKFRDFGPGLSREDVLHLWTTYFQSTKQDSNDYIGALGLGSKSPFSYSDVFSVISIFEGIKSTYTAYIDETGFPQITHLSDEATDEETGICIEIPVKTEDIETFEFEIRRGFYHFKTKPVVFNATINDEGNGYRLETDFFNIHPSVVRAPSFLMGSVAYPMKFEDLDKNVTMSKLFRDFYQECEKLGYFHLEFGLGELDIAASREAISYDPRTRQSIQQRIDDITEYLEREIVSMYESMSAIDAVYAIKVGYTGSKSNTTEILKNLLIRIMSSNTNHFLGKMRNAQEIDSAMNEGFKHFIPSGWNGKQYSLVSRSYRYNKVLSFQRDISSNSKTFLMFDDPVIIINDLGAGYASKIKDAIRENLVKNGDGTTAKDFIIILEDKASKKLKTDDINAIKDHYAKFNSTCWTSSDLFGTGDYEARIAESKKTSSSNKGYWNSKYIELNYRNTRYYSTKSSHWQTEKDFDSFVDDGKPVYYMVLNGLTPVLPEKFRNDAMRANVVDIKEYDRDLIDDICNIYNIPVGRIIGVKPKAVPELHKSKIRAKNFFDVLNAVPIETIQSNMKRLYMRRTLAAEMEWATVDNIQELRDIIGSDHIIVNSVDTEFDITNYDIMSSWYGGAEIRKLLKMTGNAECLDIASHNSEENIRDLAPILEKYNELMYLKKDAPIDFIVNLIQNKDKECIQQ